MNDKVIKPSTVTAYIAAFPVKTQAILKKLRQLVKAAVPEALESLSYGMPAFKLNGIPLIYFAAYEKHIGVYATPQTHVAFKKDLAGFKQGKGSVQFPLDQPMPYELIKAMVQFKAGTLDSKAAAKKPKKKISSRRISGKKV